MPRSLVPGPVRAFCLTQRQLPTRKQQLPGVLSCSRLRGGVREAFRACDRHRVTARAPRPRQHLPPAGQLTCTCGQEPGSCPHGCRRPAVSPAPATGQAGSQCHRAVTERTLCSSHGPTWPGRPAGDEDVQSFLSGPDGGVTPRSNPPRSVPPSLQAVTLSLVLSACWAGPGDRNEQDLPCPPLPQRLWRGQAASRAAGDHTE